MYLARSTTGIRISATRDERGFCPSCCEQLTAKMGDINVWHWSHRPGQACPYRKATTFWQYGWISHYHSLGGGWEVEAQAGGFDFDGVNRETKHALMLAEKLDQSVLQAFVSASDEQGLKPVIIFHTQAFKSFQFKDYRLQHPRRADNGWVFFFQHAFHGHKRTASLWLDIDKAAAPRFGLGAGVYNLYYSGDPHGSIIVNPTPRLKQL